jgi:phosphonate transport system permease protein
VTTNDQAGSQVLARGERLRRAVRLGLALPVVDVLFLAALWVLGTAFFGFVLHGEETYLLVPWWWMALAVIEGAALWGSFAASPGLRLFGVRFREARPASPLRRLRYWLGWHLFPLALVAAFLDPQGRSPQEILSGLTLAEGKPAPKPWYLTSVGWAVALLFVFTLGAAVGIIRVDFHALFTRAHRTARFWRAIASPDTAILGRGIQLLIETFFMALMATLFAVPVAAALSFFAARNLMRGLTGRSAYTLVRVAASLTRSVDAVIWAIIFAVWVGVGSFAGALALWLHSIVDLLKLYSEQLESIDPGPVEAVTATGASLMQVIRYGIVPQIINPYLSFTLYRWDINVRMATVVGLVGGGGIGFRLAQYLQAWAFAEATMLTILIVILVWGIDYFSARLRAKLA